MFYDYPHHPALDAAPRGPVALWMLLALIGVILGSAAELPVDAALAAGEILRIQAPRGLEVHCEAGHLWITEEAQPDDVWLAPGQRVRLVGAGLALLEAKGAARLTISRSGVAG